MTQTWLVVHTENGALVHDVACARPEDAEQIRSALQAAPVGGLFTYSVIGPIQVAR